MPRHRLRPVVWSVPVLLVGYVLAAAPARESVVDPLPSWRDGTPKRAILDFLRRVSDPDARQRLPESERVAVIRGARPRLDGGRHAAGLGDGVR